MVLFMPMLTRLLRNERLRTVLAGPTAPRIGEFRPRRRCVRVRRTDPSCGTPVGSVWTTGARRRAPRPRPWLPQQATARRRPGCRSVRCRTNEKKNERFGANVSFSLGPLAPSDLRSNPRLRTRIHSSFIRISGLTCSSSLITWFFFVSCGKQPCVCCLLRSLLVCPGGVLVVAQRPDHAIAYPPRGGGG